MEVIQILNESDNKQIWEIIPYLSENELSDIIKICRDSYYNNSISLLSDEIFDILMEKLKILNPESEVLNYVGATIKGKKVKLPYWMGSMDKIKTEESVLNKWITKHLGPYVISNKLDGISCLLTQKNGEIRMYTRGNGSEGQNVSHLLEYININIEDLPENIAIRGELIMSIENFAKYTKKMSNARNMVGGVVNSKPESVNKKYARDVDFIAYEIIEPKYKPSEQLKKMKEWDLVAAPYDIYEDIDLDILDDILTKRKKRSLYEIDGLVVTDNNRHTRNLSGNPSYSFAYKGLTQTAKTKVIEIIWTPSKDGLLIPRIHFEKVRLSQADIEYATGFHAKFINDNNIGPGAIITIIRSGDVIPYILGVNKPSKRVGLPKVYEYEWDKNEVNIILVNADTDQTVVIKRITKFLNDIGVENMSEGTVTKLVINGYDTIFKIIQMDIDDIIELEGFQETLANKIYNNLHSKLKEVNILKLMNASNTFGRGFGERKLKKILNVYPNIIQEYKTQNHNKWHNNIMQLEGFDTITVDKFIEGLEKFLVFYKKFTRISPVKPYVSNIKKSGTFKNQTIVFTGFRNKDWQVLIESEGGKISSTVSKNTTLLVFSDGEESSAKYKKAISLNIPTISKSKFAKSISI